MFIKYIQLATVLVLSFAVITGCSNEAKAPKQPIAEENKTETPNPAKEKYEAALSLYNAGKIDEAKSILEECIKLDAANGIYEYYLGNIYRKQNDLNKAHANYQNAVAKSPDLIEGYNNIVAIQMYNQDFDNALLTANKGLQVKPDFADLKFKLGQIYFVQNKFEESIKVLSEITSDPKYFEAYRFIGFGYMQLNKKQEAVTNMKKYLELAPEGLNTKVEVANVVKELESKK
ncbi:tetratricopeptide repeat protein [Brevibacillus sp. HB1.2]|uniref:tetratricopeptide repeat protein n=1 Tax=Brevibacillus sp. HB1.2 TaxID=2738807 RepID=UPI0015753736|nr:tetratricopeptide repeat protein [Brevibacillus sp. HB1.2]NTU21747.1 tetratricopeptide repeat protein [Brevibacillus sp. HB1.2]